ncbi:putative peptidase S8 propeptide/proteinase inhibitor I9 [Helianthus annuus]|nr:putative peptidase S8 propeptide/proteinase inhibitor I9 [Helianthus annuus]
MSLNIMHITIRQSKLHILRYICFHFTTYSSQMAQPMNVVFIFTLIVISITSSSSTDDHQAYIVHMDKSMMPSPFSNHHHWYTSVLSSLSDEAPATHLYTYYHVMDGFSAVLTMSQLKQLQKMPAHLATFEEKAWPASHNAHTYIFGTQERSRVVAGFWFW